MSNTHRLVDELWSSCNLLRDDGVGTTEHTEELAHLLFLTIAQEREARSLSPERMPTRHCSWQVLLDADGDELESTHRHAPEDLGRQPSVLGTTFRKAQNRIQDPDKFTRGAEDTRSGAGQHSTPRALVQAIVDCIGPTVEATATDPAARWAPWGSNPQPAD